MAYIADAYPAPNPVVAPKIPPPVKTRFASIDALKGLAILALWIVNSAPTTAPNWLRPGHWGHPTFADIIFPALILGIGAGLAVYAEFSKTTTHFGTYFLKCASRAFWLILFGVIVASAIARRPVLGLGALQLLGLAYLINALLARTHLIFRGFVAEGMLLAFYAWVRLTPVPNTLPGTFDEHSNIIRYVNDLTLAPQGLSGLFALISITSIMMMGTVAGSVYQMEDNRFKRGIIIALTGATLAFFGWLWSLDLAMTATWWTSSYALFAAGIAGAVLGLFIIAFDFDDGHKFSYPIMVTSTCVLLGLAGPPLLKAFVLDNWRMPVGDENLGKGLQQLVTQHGTYPWMYTLAIVLLWWFVMVIAYHRRKWVKEKYGLD